MKDKVFWGIMWVLLLSGVGLYSYLASSKEIEYNSGNDYSKKHTTISYRSSETKN